MNTEARVLICGADEAGVGGNSTVAVQDIQSEPYESSQYSFVDRVCEFLERNAIEHGSDVKFCSPGPRQEPPQKTPACESQPVAQIEPDGQLPIP